MKEVSLFEHNEIAYKKLCDMLQDHKTATIDHATGTGKSFIALKYLYENNDKKFLYLAPTYPIIDQLLNSTYKIGLTPEDINIDTMIYTNLLGKNMNEFYNQYDGFIFDEYHRTGAPETYKQIKRLKLNLIKHDDDKKFIGLTATPIRYLDYERNMTQEIFDGNVASKLPLADAMIQDLLPIPQYITSKAACRTQAMRIKKRIDNMSDTEDKRKLEKMLSNEMKDIGDIDTNMAELVKQYVTKKDFKLIFFNRNISVMNRNYEMCDKWFKKFGDIKKFKVSSNQNRKSNKKQLDEFNETKEGISVLFCVDILNEGVHVDDIDGVVLLRGTKSPIIYFQQIGRALSFSGRKKDIVILDLVNNFGNHNAIDAVYDEFEEEIKKRIVNDPENREKYENKLAKFKILDETKELIQRLNNIENELSTERIIASKIDFAIETLSKLPDSQKSLIFGKSEEKNCYMDICRYAKFVTNEQFERLLNIDIILPEQLCMSLDDRKEFVGQYDSIHEKEKHFTEEYSKNIVGFIEKQNRRPDVKSENEYERKIAAKYWDFLPYFEDSFKKEIKLKLIEKKIPLISFEKVFYNERLTLKDVRDIIEKGNKCISENKQLPNFYKDAMESILTTYTLEENEDIYDILRKNDEIINKAKTEYEKTRFDKISKVFNVLSENIHLPEEELAKKINIRDNDVFSRRDNYIIREKFKRLKSDYIATLIRKEEPSDIGLLCRKAKSANSAMIAELFRANQEDLKMNKSLQDVVNFMIKNEGILPKIDSKDKTEKRLAEQLEEYRQKELLADEFDNLDKDSKSMIYSPTRILYTIIMKNYNEASNKQIILKCIDFMNKNSRRPLINSLDEKEKKLAFEFQNYCMKTLSAEQLDDVNKLFNAKTNLRNTCMNYIKNIKAKEER